MYIHVRGCVDRLDRSQFVLVICDYTHEFGGKVTKNKGVA